ncbi:MAG: efflux RND transporter permease subunit [Eubacteriales bacterium]|nr:efflux RND transporter permease subunit [Eubacteriales bacterium]
MNLTKIALKRPVSVILIILALAVFGLTSIPDFKMQLIPDMDMPMLIVMTTYVGADPESVEELVTSVVEDAGATLNGIETVTSQSSENVSMVLFSYEYGVDIDECYADLRTALDTASLQMPEDAGTPVVIELNMNQTADMTLSAMTQDNMDLRKKIEDELVPELESIADVAQVSVSGGAEDYIQVLLKEEAMKQYGLTMSSVATYLAAVDFTVPAGSVKQGSQDVSVSTSMEYNNVQKLMQVPIITSTGGVVTLSDIADVSQTKEAADTVSKSNGQENISISIQKKQSASVVQVTDKVQAVMEEFSAKNQNVSLIMQYNSADSITASLWSVAKTLVSGVIISMLVLFLFFGDVKASLIVGSSMPISLLATIILMHAMGYSLNIVTLGSLVIAIGMIVDNSIVVIESCFRAQDTEESFKEAAFRGTKVVTMSIIASTITTVVVYLPMALVDDLVGQLFGQLCFTIVFAMTASLISAMTLVPLFYNLFQPKEKKESRVNALLDRFTAGYQKFLRKILHRKGLTIVATLLLVVIAGLMLTQINMELMPAADEGIVDVAASFRPGTTLETKEEAMSAIEELAKAEADVESYSLTVNSDSSASLRAYLKSGRELSTADIVEKWNQETKDFTDMELDITSGGSSMSGSMMNTTTTEIDLQGTDMEALKEAARDVKAEMEQVDGVIKVVSSTADASTAAKIVVDPLMSMHYGMMPVQVAQELNQMLSGMTALTITNQGAEYDVKLEYPDDLYDDINSLMDAVLINSRGMQVPLREIAEVVYTDAPQTITKVDGKYQVSLTATTTQEAQYSAKKEIQNKVENMVLPSGVEQSEDMMTSMMNEEFGVLYESILVAIFLVFLVMAMQFESPRFSLMVMMCIPFSLIGSIFLLFITRSTLSMVSLMGFLMLVGIVVNNGILYVDTVNQLREEMPLEDALVQSGSIRLRPILMTTLTTILSMLPLGMGIGDNAQMMQGMALVIIGGLIASTLLTLLLMPTVYLIIDKKNRKEKDAAARVTASEEAE